MNGHEIQKIENSILDIIKRYNTLICFEQL